MIVVLVLISAFLHALWNALLRLERDKDGALIAAVGVATLIAILVAAIRWTFGEVPFGTTTAAGWAIGAGVFEWLYFVALAKALAAGALAPVYTISRGGAIVLVWPLSIALFDEPLALGAAIGSAIVLAGLVASGWPSRLPRGAGFKANLGRSVIYDDPSDRSATTWAIACAVAIAGYHLAYKAALASGGNPSAVFAVALVVATAINLGRLDAGRRRAVVAIVRGRTPRVIVMGAICGGSFLILMEALATGGAGFVLTLRNTSVLFAAGLAIWIGERPKPAQLAGAILVAAGAIVMAWR